ncbi:GNAT family N-acetyltransferase [Pseudalkalibacillus sp. SCS-8]|uniref:GNAT family N-acetyltransferase n=1 Tax=Pseudalkalibacillus nanhaiensis TaxID=3115291 RepID=UPI0032DAC1BA
MLIRNSDTRDFKRIIPRLNEWWGGREVAHLLPRFLFEHFQDTSFIVEEDDHIVGFLIGFRSQTREDEAYIHLIGVHPDFRKLGLGRKLYHTFFAKVQEMNINKVYAITSPINEHSILFHRQMGFLIIPGDEEVNGVSVQTNYDGQGNDRVLFVKDLSKR